MSHSQASRVSVVALEASILQTWPRIRGSRERLLLAVSGGADSVAMLRAILRVHSHPELIEVGHFNHHLRGSESDADQDFVQRLCSQQRLKCWLGQPGSDDAPILSEESARLARYRFLEQTAYSIGARYVLTAHTASDRVETMLHNLFRGTGLKGIRSIQTTRDLGAELVLVRPLLQCSRQDVVAYLAELGQAFRQDSSNQDLSYKRNQIRHEILPVIRSGYGARVDERFLAFADQIAEIESWILRQASEYLEQVALLASKNGGKFGNNGLASREIAVPLHQVLPVDWPVLRSALAIRYHQLNWSLGKMSRGHWNAIRAMHQQLDLESRQHNLPCGLQLSVQGDWLFIKQPCQ